MNGGFTYDQYGGIGMDRNYDYSGSGIEGESTFFTQ